MLLPRLTMLALALTALTAAPAQAGDSPAAVRVLSCSPWQEGLGGTVSYESRMRSVPGSARMAIRFDMLERVLGRRYRRVSRGDVHRSSEGASSFRWQHKVEGLRLGAVYRTLVHFRWYAADGTRLQGARRLSPRCRQPGGPANLRIAGIEIAGGRAEGTARYDVTVVNRGGTAASGVGVLLRVDRDVVDEVTLPVALAPGESRTVSFTGPVCRRRVRAVADPQQTVAESREGDNVRTADCAL